MSALAYLALLVGAPVSTSTVWIAPGTPTGVRVQLDGQIADIGWRAERGEDETRRPWLIVRGRGGDFELELLTADGSRYDRRLEGLGVGSAGAEGVALVVRGALAAVARGEAPAGLRAVQPPPSAVDLRGGFGLSGGWLGPGRPSVGVDGQLSVHGDLFGAGVRLGGRWSPERVEEEVGVQALRLDAVGFAQLDVHVFFVRGLLGLAMWRRSTRSLEAAVAGTEPSWTAGLLVGLEAGARARWESFELELTAGVDASLPRPRFLVLNGPELTGPAALQPFVRGGCVWR